MQDVNGRNAELVLVALKERDNLGDTDVDVRVVLKRLGGNTSRGQRLD